MKFYLARHAEAEDGPQMDPTRGLTKTGEAEVPIMAAFLRTQTNKIALVVHSDLKRGRDTAEPIAEELKVPTVETPLVGPDGDPKTVMQYLRKLQKDLDEPDGEILLVSHGPFINSFAAWLLDSGEGDKFHFAHGTVCHFDTLTPPGYGEEGRTPKTQALLHWMATPKLMNRAMEQDRKAVIESAGRLVDALALMVEAPRGESLKHPKHLKLVAPLREVVKDVASRYFTAQGLAILKAVRKNIPAALEKHREAPDDKGKKFASDVLPDDVEPLTFAVGAAEINVWNQALSDAIKKAAAQLAKDLKSGATLAPDAAEDYLAEHSLEKLTGGWDETTLGRLRNALADSYSSGGTADDIEQALKDTVAEFSTKRAAMIAQTEVNDAYNYGRRELADEAGMNEKAWDPDGEACEVCEDNVAAGWIPIDEDFPSGDDGPTAHPNCDCSLSFRLAA